MYFLTSKRIIYKNDDETRPTSVFYRVGPMGIWVGFWISTQGPDPNPNTQKSWIWTQYSPKKVGSGLGPDHNFENPNQVFPEALRYLIIYRFPAKNDQITKRKYHIFISFFSLFNTDSKYI